MEESQELEKLPRVVTGVLKVVLSFSLIALAVVLIIALAKITYTLAIMVFNTSSVVPYDVAEQAVMFFLYFGFIGLIVKVAITFLCDILFMRGLPPCCA